MKYTKGIVIGILMIALIGGYYYYLSHRDAKPADESVEITRLDEVVLKQLDQAYPPTPREVIKFYNQFIECVYSDEYSDTQFNQLVDQARQLMDQELLEANPLEDYKTKLKAEIAAYKDKKQKIIQTGVCASDEVIYREIEKKKCAYVQTTYFMKEGNGDFFRTYQRYLLRMDQNDKWKILSFYLMDGPEDEA